MDVIKRIDEIMKARGWTDYRLAQEADISPSTLANIRKRGSLPSIPTLECICNAFDVSLSDFFAEDTYTVQLNGEQKEFFEKWVVLTDKQKELINELVSEMKSE